MLKPYKPTIDLDIINRAAARISTVRSVRGQQELLAALTEFNRANDEFHAFNQELAEFIDQQQKAIETLRDTILLLTEQNNLLKDIMRTHGIELPGDNPTLN